MQQEQLSEAGEGKVDETQDCAALLDFANGLEHPKEDCVELDEDPGQNY